MHPANLNERYFSGLPLQPDAADKKPVGERVRFNPDNLLLSVVAVVSLLLLVFYVVLIRPLRKNATGNPATAKETGETGTSDETNDPDRDDDDESQSEQDDDSNDPDEGKIIVLPGSPRR